MIMHKSMVLLALMAAFVCGLPIPASTQDTKEAPNTPERQFATYHLELSINELVEGKKINSRHYSLNVSGPNGIGAENLKIGTRVPVQSEEGKFQYLDIGTSITVKLSSYTGGPVPFPPMISVDVDISSLADPNQGKPGNLTPLIRQVRLAGASPVIVDKPMIMASADDPDSNHGFQLIVLATKLN
jgi:hypothetical protein